MVRSGIMYREGRLEIHHSYLNYDKEGIISENVRVIHREMNPFGKLENTIYDYELKHKKNKL